VDHIRVRLCEIDVYVAVSKRFKVVPILGSVSSFGTNVLTSFDSHSNQFHGTDLLDAFFVGQELRDYVIHFVNKLDPNGGGLFDFNWPEYTTDNPKQLIFLDGLIPQVIGEDTYRQEPMDYFNKLLLNVPI